MSFADFPFTALRAGTAPFCRMDLDAHHEVFFCLISFFIAALAMELHL